MWHQLATVKCILDIQNFKAFLVVTMILIKMVLKFIYKLCDNWLEKKTFGYGHKHSHFLWYINSMQAIFRYQYTCDTSSAKSLTFYSTHRFVDCATPFTVYYN